TADGADLDLHRPARIVLDLDDRADADRAARSDLDDLGAVQARPQRPDARLEQTLLVLGGVVLEVLGQVAELARLRDRSDDLLTPGPLELGELLAQRVGLLLREPLAVYHFERRPRRELYTTRGRATFMPVSSKLSTWPCSRATRLTSACWSGRTSVMPVPPRPARPVRPTRCVYTAAS